MLSHTVPGSMSGNMPQIMQHATDCTPAQRKEAEIVPCPPITLLFSTLLSCTLLFTMPPAGVRLMTRLGGRRQGGRAGQGRGVPTGPGVQGEQTSFDEDGG